MADFVNIAANPSWPNVPDPVFIGNRTSPVVYIQDQLGSDKTQRVEADVQGDEKDKYDAKDSKNQLLQQAIQWPVSAMTEKCALPFAAAAVVAFWLTPTFVPDTGIGAAIMSGYVAGGLEYYLQFRGQTQLKQ